MAEGYVFTSATDVNDLLNQIVSQAAVHGWTQHRLDGLGGGLYMALASGMNPLAIAGAGLALILVGALF